MRQNVIILSSVSQSPIIASLFFEISWINISNNSCYLLHTFQLPLFQESHAGCSPRPDSLAIYLCYSIKLNFNVTRSRCKINITYKLGGVEMQNIFRSCSRRSSQTKLSAPTRTRDTTNNGTATLNCLNSRLLRILLRTVYYKAKLNTMCTCNT